MNINLLIILIILLIILYVQSSYFKEKFNSKNSNTDINILVFVSKTCGHCVNYNNNVHDKLETLAKAKGWNLKRIYSDEDPENLFSKYNVIYVPTCFIIKNDNVKQVSGSITLENIENTINSM